MCGMKIVWKGARMVSRRCQIVPGKRQSEEGVIWYREVFRCSPVDVSCPWRVSDSIGHRALAPLDSCSRKSWYASDSNVIRATVGFCHRSWGYDEGV